MIGLAGLSAARAEVQVIESDTPEYRVGARFPDDWTPQLARGKSVTVRLSSGDIKVFRGPETSGPPTGGTRGLQIK